MLEGVRKLCGSLLLVIIAGTGGGGAPAQSTVPAKPDITVTLLGSGGGTNPNPRRFGPSILVRSGTETLLFD